MAPSPENDNAPKAPDKNVKTKGETATTTAVTDTKTDNQEIAASNTENKEASVSRLDDIELKALLDEAINYKIPKDRVGKSKLFQNLLEKAEEDDRKARATSASGSESVRYYNTTASQRPRRRQKPNSVSENLTHGGSLNNLAKEELYAIASHLHNKPPKTVSTRQRQGGSLPCNVNAGITHDKQFFEEETRRRMETKKAEYTTIDMESESLLEHDSLLNQDYNEQSEMEVVQTRIPRVPPKFTSRFNLEIGSSGASGAGGNTSGMISVDDALTVAALDRVADKSLDGGEVSYKPVESIAATPGMHYSSTAAQYSLLMPGPIWSFNRKSLEDKKVDENGNALGQNNTDSKKSKKKKIQTDKNVVVVEAKDLPGHRGDIINDLDKLVEYIGGNDEQTGTKSKSNLHKTKFNKHHFVSGDDKTSNKKQRIRSKGKPEKLQKSNSMEEISISKLDDFNFTQDGSDKVALRSTKSNSERPRERRSWGNSESLPLHASAENLESSDFRVVTKKKKSKKRRNSVSGRRQPYSRDVHGSDFNRVPLPEPRRKSACSVPHSDKSNDSSDVDSVHSLPIDSERVNIDTDRLNSNMPISYADIAKNSNSLDRPKWNRPPSERRAAAERNKNLASNVVVPVEVNENTPIKSDLCEKAAKVKSYGTIPVAVVTTTATTTATPIAAATAVTTTAITACPVLEPNLGANNNNKNVVPDVHNIQNWPTIQNNNNNINNKNVSSVLTTLSTVSTFTTNKNNNQVVIPANKMLSLQNKASQSNNNLKNNFKNIQQQNRIEKQQQYSPSVRNNNVIPNHVEAAVQLIQNSNQICGNNVQVLPRNIPDVQTIEKMHFKQLQEQQQLQQQQQQQQQHNLHHEIISNHVAPLQVPLEMPPSHATCYFEQQTLVGVGGSGNGNNGRMQLQQQQQQCIPLNETTTGNMMTTVTSASENCDSERTSSRPAVVILSGDGSKDVSGLTFGFDINEQLLSDDVCDNFTARFFVPDAFQSHNHDKIVNFIGLAWEDTINQTNGKVKYFNDHL